MAVQHEEHRVSYEELNQRANQLAHHLASLGAGPDKIVAILLNRPIDVVTAILATFKAGSAYLPLDPGYPVERLEYMLNDAQPCVLVTEERFAQSFPGYHAAQVAIDTDRAEIERLPKGNPDLPLSTSHLAYVIYTSGSQGKAKGVMVSHKNLFHSITARLLFYPEKITAFMLLSSFSFSTAR